MNATRRRLILAIVATDNTFSEAAVRGERVWTGKCIHCRTRLMVSAEGEPLGKASIEHIVPRHHGGTDDVENVALACARCNALKGARLDRRRRGDPDLEAMIERLQERRRERWREAP